MACGLRPIVDRPCLALSPELSWRGSTLSPEPEPRPPGCSLPERRRTASEYDRYLQSLPADEYRAAHILVATESLAFEAIAELAGGAQFVEVARKAFFGRVTQFRRRAGLDSSGQPAGRDLFGAIVAATGRDHNSPGTDLLRVARAAAVGQTTRQPPFARASREPTRHYAATGTPAEIPPARISARAIQVRAHGA